MQLACSEEKIRPSLPIRSLPIPHPNRKKKNESKKKDDHTRQS